MVPVASSFRTAREIYERGRNKTSKEKRVGTNSENSRGSLEVYLPEMESFSNLLSGFLCSFVSCSILTLTMRSMVRT